MNTALAVEIRRHDPLRADAACARVPAMNARADVNALASALRGVLPSDAAVAAIDDAACLAAMRDIGIFLGSLRRHGVEPLVAVPDARRPLLALGGRADMVPRDTVYLYGPWNPPGPRQRMYTGDPAEDVLIHSVRVTAPHLASCLADLEQASDAPTDDPALAALCGQSATHLQAMVGAIDFVREALPPFFFARVLRPYFQEIVVDGQTYLGPAAAHLPLYLIDHLLWSSDHQDAEHHQFQHETARHAPPPARALFSRRDGLPSLAGRLIQALRAAGARAAAGLRASADAVCALLRLLITFRGRHLVLARREYAEEVRLYPAGSGGATVELLERILTLTRTCAALAHQPIAASGAYPHAASEERRS
jgi:hypothetical protein